MRIILHSEAYELLREHVPPDSLAYLSLVSATKIAGESSAYDQFWIQCSDVDADMYLAAAQQFFPERVKEIEDAIAAGRV
jgi:hypothetical protein